MMISYDLKQPILKTSEDLTLSVGEESENNRLETFFFFFFPHHADTAEFSYIFITRDHPLAEILVLNYVKQKNEGIRVISYDSA